MVKEKRTTTSRRRRRRSRRVVSFDESQNSCFTDSKYPMKKRLVMYYTQSEFEIIAEENHEIVLYMQVGKDDPSLMITHDENGEEASLCTRGLESRTSKGSRRKKVHRQRSLKAVIDEQKRQQSEGICDPEIISQAYAVHTSKSRTIALTSGKTDAIVAKAIQSERPPMPVTPRIFSSPMSLFKSKKKGLDESFSTLSTLEDSLSTLNLSDHGSLHSTKDRLSFRGSSHSKRRGSFGGGGGGASTVKNFFRRGSLGKQSLHHQQLAEVDYPIS